jgi:hypothetical protein
MGETDLLANDEKQLRESVAAIKRACDEFDAERQLVYMKSFERLDNGLCVVTYEDGVTYVGNYSENDAVYKGVTVPALNIVTIK